MKAKLTKLGVNIDVNEDNRVIVSILASRLESLLVLGLIKTDDDLLLTKTLMAGLSRSTHWFKPSKDMEGDNS